MRPAWADIRIADDPPAAPRFRSLHACDACRAYWSRLPAGTGDAAYYRAKPVEHHRALEGGVGRLLRVRRAVERAVGRARFSILDVGCAQGAHLAVYGAGVEKAGVEPSLAARPALEERGIRWLGSDVEAIAEGTTFDAVTCLDVLEHLEQPGALLDGMDRVLAPGGVLALVTGDVDALSARVAGRRWLYFALPEHCSFFSWRALRRFLVDRRGYRLVRRARIANQDQDLAYVLAFLRGLAREGILRLLSAERVRAYEREGRARFSFFRDNMLVVLRKSGGRA